ncbi:MAG: GNAT family N-acetyltransferase [Micrococcales bacterium]|nr:MAG: GNAT family N-acetyltransferase [Micrococcales bacterium]PIE26153.1 MAG: GNAT family N-acetyltransferase [Micrococcales bacterium]
MLAANLTIRREEPADAPAVRDLIDSAFPAQDGTHRCAQSLIADALRADGDVIEELTFVAEHEGRIVGQVTCSAGRVDQQPVVALGPISVTPPLQRQGVGAVLMSAVVATADQRGDAAIVLTGDPDYYHAFGFRPASQFGVGSADGDPAPHLQLKPLRAWRCPGGTFHYPAAFATAPGGPVAQSGSELTQ